MKACHLHHYVDQVLYAVLSYTEVCHITHPPIPFYNKDCAEVYSIMQSFYL